MNTNVKRHQWGWLRFAKTASSCYDTTSVYWQLYIDAYAHAKIQKINRSPVYMYIYIYVCVYIKVLIQIVYAYMQSNRWMNQQRNNGLINKCIKNKHIHTRVQYLGSQVNKRWSRMPNLGTATQDVFESHVRKTLQLRELLLAFDSFHQHTRALHGAGIYIYIYLLTFTYKMSLMWENIPNMGIWNNYICKHVFFPHQAISLMT